MANKCLSLSWSLSPTFIFCPLSSLFLCTLIIHPTYFFLSTSHFLNLFWLFLSIFSCYQEVELLNGQIDGDEAREEPVSLTQLALSSALEQEVRTATRQNSNKCVLECRLAREQVGMSSFIILLAQSVMTLMFCVCSMCCACLVTFFHCVHVACFSSQILLCLLTVCCWFQGLFTSGASLTCPEDPRSPAIDIHQHWSHFLSLPVSEFDVSGVPWWWCHGDIWQ